MDFDGAVKSTALRRTQTAGTQAFDPATTKTLVCKLFGASSWEQGTQTVISARLSPSIDVSQLWEDPITEMGTLPSDDSDGDTLHGGFVTAPTNYRGDPTSIQAVEISAIDQSSGSPKFLQAAVQGPAPTSLPTLKAHLTTTIKRKPETSGLPARMEKSPSNRLRNRIEARYLTSKVRFELLAPTYANLRYSVGINFGLDPSDDLEMRLARVDYRHFIGNISRLVNDHDVVMALRMHQRDILTIRVVRRLADFDPFKLASPRRPDSARPSCCTGRPPSGSQMKHRRADLENNQDSPTRPIGAEEFFEQATRRYLRIENQVVRSRGYSCKVPQDLQREIHAIINMWSRAAALGHVGALHNLHCMDFLGIREANAQLRHDGDSSYLLSQWLVEDDEGGDSEGEKWQGGSGCGGGDEHGDEGGENVSLLSASLSAA